MNDKLEPNPGLWKTGGTDKTASRCIALTWFGAALLGFLLLLLGFLAALSFFVTPS